MFPNFIKNKKKVIQASNPLLRQMYVKHKCEFCGENAERDRVCQRCLTAEPQQFAGKTIVQKRRTLKIEFEDCCKEAGLELCDKCVAKLPQCCELCNTPGPRLCEQCTASNTPEIINRVLYGKRQKLQAEFDESAKHCYPCLSIEPGDKVECHNFTCNKYFKRVTATIRLNQFQELESEILNKL